jgi:tetratricopeptide (TPR) repeat protein
MFSISVVSTVAIAAVSSQVIERAKALVEQHKAAEAYALLEPLESENAGLAEFDYWFGVAALDAGKLDRAVIAFERVLIRRPDFNSARMDLARTYFAMGNLDLSKQEFEKLLAQNPSEQGRKAIQDYLAEIDRKLKRQLRTLSGYVEAGAGYDNNITSATANFTGAVLSSFGINNVDPTGNSIRRRAPYAAINGGADLEQVIGKGYSFVADADIRAREYRNNSDFNSVSGGGHAGIKQKLDSWAIRADLHGQWLRQDGAVPITPGSPVLNNNRNISGFRIDAQYAPVEQRLYMGQCLYSRFRYPTNSVQDTNQTLCSLTWVGEWTGDTSRLLAFSLFGGVDKALRPLNAAVSPTDVSRKQGGLRVFAQWTIAEKLDANALLGYTLRRDDQEKARAELIAIGRDKTFEAGLGLSWRFMPAWSVRSAINYTRNNSNIDLYDYARTEFQIFLRRDFE